ncbi:protein of unknown function [Candidatus Promineifilum breve]|uniref:Uncharacterized protein n=1 Tax=Candidatus Promineifilum breve TaxID=1806508 RepID=A0A160SZ39_9CHLR|nr:protein of unknown function [Candidatus Promineifilum breve]
MLAHGITLATFKSITCEREWLHALWTDYHRDAANDQLIEARIHHQGLAQ